MPLPWPPPIEYERLGTRETVAIGVFDRQLDGKRDIVAEGHIAAGGQRRDTNQSAAASELEHPSVDWRRIANDRRGQERRRRPELRPIGIGQVRLVGRFGGFQIVEELIRL